MDLWHRVKVRLGLEDEWDDEEYYEDDEYYDDDPAEAENDWGSRSRSAAPSPYESGAGPNAVRRVDRGPDLDRARVSAGNPALRSVPSGSTSVHRVSPQVKMQILEPKSFGEVQSIGDKFKEGNPVILNLSMTSPDLAKRVLDFASGLTYGLDGGLQKVSEKVFMLTPQNVEVSDADRRKLRDTGLFGE